MRALALFEALRVGSSCVLLARGGDVAAEDRDDTRWMRRVHTVTVGPNALDYRLFMAAHSQAPLVLIAEDYADTRELYAMFLERAGYRIATAENGQQAVDLARRLHPRVIIMDLAMPIMTGWEAAAILKEDADTRGIIIIVVTGNGAGADANGGAWDRFVLKPCRPADLAAHVRDAMTAQPHG